MRDLYLGIDIGGWKIRGVLWDGRRVVAAHELRTPKTRAGFIRALRFLTSKLSGRTNDRVRGIGIGAAGVVRGAMLRLSPNISYLRRFNFRTLFPATPLSVDNDARAFARAEWRYGAGRGAGRILAITLGTGIGRAYGARGRIARIKKLEYPQVWERRFQHLRDKGDDEALAAFVAEKISVMVKRYQPKVLIFGGGVTERTKFFGKLKAELRNRWPGQPIRRAKLGRNAAAIGAALLFSGE